ncbi:putative tRNA adenosine deaminase-associated protein [Blastococcus aurantiacus]|uniref:Putative tRNA adenosine deaminase-associated protein n=1 Tax=Blastococcus aurantiacus TaxID=1550231 RepID=A0A1G7MNL3_9ACTN|nr:tRNA adenosine deaminase-associated protein [Blastococcus aurantiacus]SDF63382.1 putative tRNA adenosine deaminase-associated protein [Blastococcus aurantiacus]
MSAVDGAPAGPASYAVRVSRAGARWRVDLLAEDAGDELPVLERALGDAGAWPPPFVVVVDSRLYFVVLRHGPGGMVRALISDATMLEWVLAAEVVERYGIGVDTDGAFDDDESGWPGGDMDVFADDGLPAEELRTIVTADDLWADEMVQRIAARLGFDDELAAAVNS